MTRSLTLSLKVRNALLYFPGCSDPNNSKIGLAAAGLLLLVLASQGGVKRSGLFLRGPFQALGSEPVPLLL